MRSYAAWFRQHGVLHSAKPTTPEVQFFRLGVHKLIVATGMRRSGRGIPGEHRFCKCCAMLHRLCASPRKATDASTQAAPVQHLVTGVQLPLQRLHLLKLRRPRSLRGRHLRLHPSHTLLQGSLHAIVLGLEYGHRAAAAPQPVSPVAAWLLVLLLSLQVLLHKAAAEALPTPPLTAAAGFGSGAACLLARQAWRVAG